MHPLMIKAGIGALKLGVKQWEQENARRRAAGRPTLEKEVATAAQSAWKSASKTVKGALR